ncbi:MAG: ATP-binding cassette domain-containing protein [Gammaproteobacteria bacterium]|nr:ATP-binding cassette domain-containing protein [Gammaproteobacteria bacterium]
MYATPKARFLELITGNPRHTPYWALRDLSFELAPGETLGIVGRNGAGKSTLFSLITRLFIYATGAIDIYGYNLLTQSRRALAQLGVVFQQPTLDLDLTLRQNLRYHCALQGIDYSLHRAEIDDALQRIGLAEQMGDQVRQLSGGQRRRVELVRALLHKPRLLLADEATVGLDIHSRQAILDQVRDRCHNEGVGVLWATHLVDEVQPTDKLVVLHGGRVMAIGSAAQVMEDTGSETVHQAFSRLTRSVAR